MKLHRELRATAAPVHSAPLLTAAFAISLAAFSACVKDASGPQDEAVAVEGTYALEEVGGNALPATIYEGPWNSGGQQIQVRLEMASGSLELDEEGSYTILMQIRITTGGKSGPASLSDTGSYTRSGDTVTFRSNKGAGDVFTGRLRNGSLTLQLDIVGDRHAQIYEFRK
jgi:hypothetical protein